MPFWSERGNFGQSPQSTGDGGVPHMNGASDFRYRNPVSLASWTRYLLFTQIVVSIVALYAGYLERDLLVTFRDADPLAQKILLPAFDTSDARVAMVGWTQLAVFVVSGFLILRWIHRMNWNARALGATDLEYTPGYAIGFYFVPILTLYKPYQAMKEIWRASANPSDWKSQPVPGLLASWWTLWLVNGALGQAAARLGLRAEGLDAYLTYNMVMLVSDAADIPLCAIFIVIINRVMEMQTAAYSAVRHRLPRIPGEVIA